MVRGEFHALVKTMNLPFKAFQLDCCPVLMLKLNRLSLVISNPDPSYFRSAGCIASPPRGVHRLQATN